MMMLSVQMQSVILVRGRDHAPSERVLANIARCDACAALHALSKQRLCRSVPPCMAWGVWRARSLDRRPSQSRCANQLCAITHHGICHLEEDDDDDDDVSHCAHYFCIMLAGRIMHRNAAVVGWVDVQQQLVHVRLVLLKDVLVGACTAVRIPAAGTSTFAPAWDGL